MKPKFFKNREGINRTNPVASKLATAQFKPKLIPNKKKNAKDVPDLGEALSLYCDWTSDLD